MSKKHIIFLCLLSVHLLGMAQEVPKKVIVEHFTNSLCSICAARNPGFITNLQAHDSVLYISYHPSSPYVNCIFSKHNPRQNDGRTKFYGVFGNTPRLVIQGTPVSTIAAYDKPSLFAPYLGKTSPVKLEIRQFKSASAGVVVSRIVIKTVAPHVLTDARLYLVLAEDTINYAAPNGENVHYNVFRRALTDSNGLAVTIPQQVGDSLVLKFNSPIHAGWDINKILHVAILQDNSNNQVIQSELSRAADNDHSLQIQHTVATDLFVIYPNPVSDRLNFQMSDRLSGPVKLEIINMFGETLPVETEGQVIKLEGMADGIYLLKLESETYSQVIRFRKASL